MELEGLQPSNPTVDDTIRTDSVFTDFRILTASDVQKLIDGSATKSCSLDPIPTYILKQILDILLPSITDILNLSRSSGQVPDDFKMANLSALLKKLSMDPEILKHFRPISNLPYVSKLVESSVVNDVRDYAIENGLLDPDQSAYQQYHSTETVLLKVGNDVLVGIDSDHLVALILVDLSSAFDTVKHAIMLHRLHTYLGISGTALEWFRSYLSNRKQTVIINGASSTPRDLKYGVPQGSVLGPFLFSIYLLPLREILLKHGIPYKLYADDNQIYIIFERREGVQANLALKLAVHDARQWLIENFQKVNDSKTELLLISSMHQPPAEFPEFTVGDEVIVPADSVRNLGFIFDSHMRFDRHITSVVQASFCNLRDLYRIRPYIPQDSLETLVHSFITSRVDYCNSLLYGLPKKQINRLQAVQNSAARLVTFTHKFDHITPVLMELHWLRVPQRIIFKILLFTFKCLHKLAPAYLQDLLTWRQPNGLRSDNKLLLHVPKSRLVTYGDRAFSVAAPKLWNALPLSVKSNISLCKFKRDLKTYLFNESYNV